MQYNRLPGTALKSHLAEGAAREIIPLSCARHAFAEADTPWQQFISSAWNYSAFWSHDTLNLNDGSGEKAASHPTAGDLTADTPGTQIEAHTGL